MAVGEIDTFRMLFISSIAPILTFQVNSSLEYLLRRKEIIGLLNNNMLLLFTLTELGH